MVATIASGWVRTAVTMAVGLAATPALVRFLGPERFGAARVADQWFAYLDFLRFGLGQAIGVLLLRAATSGTEADVAGTVRTGIRLLARQSRWLLPVAAGLVAVFPFAFDLPIDLRAEFYRAAPAILLGVCLSPLATFRSVLEARQQSYLVDIGLTAQALAVAALGVGFAAAGFGLTGQLYGIALGTVIYYALCAYLAGAMARRFWAVPATPLPGRAVWRLQWPLLIALVGNQISLSSDNLLAGALIGVSEVTALMLTQRLLQVSSVVAGSINGTGMWAGLVDLRARVGPEAFRDRLAEASKLNVGINLLVLGPALGYNRRFVGLWVGDWLYAGDLVNFATFAQMMVFNFSYLFAALIDSFGQTRRRVWVSAAGTALKIALLVPFVRQFGLAGLPLATLVGYLCTDAWFCPMALCRDHGISGRVIMAGVGRAVAVGGGWAGVCYLVGSRGSYQIPGWTGLLSEVATLEAIGLAIGWTLLLSASDRATWRDRVRKWFA